MIARRIAARSVLVHSLNVEGGPSSGTLGERLLLTGLVAGREREANPPDVVRREQAAAGDVQRGVGDRPAFDQVGEPRARDSELVCDGANRPVLLSVHRSSSVALCRRTTVRSPTCERRTNFPPASPGSSCSEKEAARLHREAGPHFPSAVPFNRRTTR